MKSELNCFKAKYINYSYRCPKSPKNLNTKKNLKKKKIATISFYTKVYPRKKIAIQIY
jgi:hypothetical protein